MLASIHQPQYLPWLGYFEKIEKADVFIILDDVQYKKNDWQNRNRIRTHDGWQWLTVPVCHKHGQLIQDIQIDTHKQWVKSHQHAIKQHYHKAEFYSLYESEMMALLERPWEKLVDLNMAWIQFLCQHLGIKTKIVFSSQYQCTSTSSQRLIDLCTAVGANQYLAGADGKSYMDLALFEKAGIEVSTQDYQHPSYPQVVSQKNQEFISHLCALDLLLNCGPKSKAILLTGGECADSSGRGAS